MNIRQKLFLTLVVVGNVLLWVIPSNVVELVARDRHTLLGRYSKEHFNWIVGVLLISVIGLYIDQARSKETYKRRWFQVLATLAFLVPTLAAADFLLRVPETSHYVKDSLAYHRPPNAAYTEIIEDRPQARRTYPNAPSGRPPIHCTLHTDARGFRNQTALEQYDVVVLGDSFAEGSSVSDEHPWPVRFAELVGLSVYNLGMSGYAPVNYLASLKEYGLALEPRYVVCMIYEGNDFRSTRKVLEEQRPQRDQRIKHYFKQSPILSRLENLFVDTFGPIGADRDADLLEVLSWLPLRIPDGPDGNYYAFAPKQLLQSYRSREMFDYSRHWASVSATLGDLSRTCREAGAQLIVYFAPTKAHVTLPIVFDSLPPEKVHAFATLRSDELPDPATFMSTLGEFLQTKELALQEWCAEESVPFATATNALRQAAVQGDQVYFTYDQHWTPVGHQVVATALHQFWTDSALDTPPHSALTKGGV
ncbi:MAG: hypothetical protein IID39_00180 [Planctomycetes bacterium]|nr:hypothetical protein [Planctomycetota bacterium]